MRPSSEATSSLGAQPTRSPESMPAVRERKLKPMAELQRPPTISWPDLRARLIQNWKPGQHWTLLGPTGRGKTHAALTLASLCRYTLVIATKRQDPLMQELSQRQLVAKDLSKDVMWHGDRPLDIHSRVIYWPRATEKMTAKQRLQFQSVEIRKALDWADRTGGWAVVIDELMWVSRNLALERELESLYFQARTQGVSVIGCAQRPRQVPLLALNQSSYLLIWQTGDKQDGERLRELSAGFPRHMIEDCVQRLSVPKHEALFVDGVRQELAVVVMPAKVPM